MKRMLVAAGAVLLLSLTACASGGVVPESVPPSTGLGPRPSPSEPGEPSSQPAPSDPAPPQPAAPRPTPSAPTESARPPFRTATPGPVGSPGASAPPAVVPTARWNAILDDLDARGVTGPADLVSAKAVTWQDGALGCPKPGVSYTQAIVEGMQVVVEVAGIAFDYRFGTGDTPLLCVR